MDAYSGQSLILGDGISTDQIHPAVYFSLDPDRVAEGLFKGIDEKLGAQVTERTVIIAGRNFGCGSSREVVVQALRLHKVRLIIAESFARIFYRNCINNGILCVESPGAYRSIQNGAFVQADMVAGVLSDTATGGSWTFRPPNATLLKILEQARRLAL